MPSKKGAASSGKGEQVKARNPAEFFAENQNIAGFDNPGKSLYTTIRELVENALDAAESVERLPRIIVEIEEFSSHRFAESRPRLAAGTFVGAFDSPIGLATAGRKRERNGSLGTEPGAAESDTASLSSQGQSKRPRSTATPAAGEIPLTARTPTALLTVPAASQSSNGSSSGKGGKTSSSSSSSSAARSTPSGSHLYSVRCTDNGCGMPHDRVPDMLGRVLSGSKYGVRQTRGKFGLGAKMALIWAKKSTGLPIEVTTAHAPTPALAAGAPPARLTECRLDIDVFRNEPRILRHESKPNRGGFRGTSLRVVVGGSWATYRSRVMQYMQQLAVITPYAELELRFAAPEAARRSFHYRWRRRSVAMPPRALEIRHHPCSVDNLKVRQLIAAATDRHRASRGEPAGTAASNASGASGASGAGGSSPKLRAFLREWFWGVSAGASKQLAEGLVKKFPGLMGGKGKAKAKGRAKGKAGGDEASSARAKVADCPVGSLGGEHVHFLTQALHRVDAPAPDGSCLSPAGEYNLRLGILKELAPDLLATFAGPASVCEGHPFVVEAGVALGGRAAQEGVTVHRFANRIPLLFEGGADVCTRTALQRIPWAQYKIDPRKDKVGVFVSIVSTRIPFKGTGKEYVGDDVVPIRKAVRQALMGCAAQLRAKLARRKALKEAQDRARALRRYVPDVARAVAGALQQALARREQAREQNGEGAHGSGSSSAAAVAGNGKGKGKGKGRDKGMGEEKGLAAVLKGRPGEATDPLAAVIGCPLSWRSAGERREAVLRAAGAGQVDTSRLQGELEAAVKRADQEAALDAALDGVEHGASMVRAQAGGQGRGGKGKGGGKGKEKGKGPSYTPLPLAVAMGSPHSASSSGAGAGAAPEERKLWIPGAAELLLGAQGGGTSAGAGRFALLGTAVVT